MTSIPDINFFDNETLLQDMFKAYKLTFGEIETARLILHGLNNAEIAEISGVQVKTIKFHATTIYKKTNTESRAQFIVRFQYEYMKLSVLHDLEGTRSRLEANWQSIIASETKRLRACEQELEVVKSSTISIELLETVWPKFLEMIKFRTGLKQSEVEQIELDIFLRLLKRHSPTKLSF